MNAAVEYLESDEYLDEQRASRFNPVLHEGEYSSIMTCGGVTAVRPMFELLEDHEAMGNMGNCYMCDDQKAPPQVVMDARRVLRSVSED